MELDSILSYLKEAYHPHTIITFGPFARGAYSPGSDLDVAVISDTARLQTESHEVEGVLVDAYVYNTKDVLAGLPTELVKLYGGRVLLDEKGYGSWLVGTLRRYVHSRRQKTGEEKAVIRSRVRAQLSAAEQDGPAGLCHLYGLLSESPGVYRDLRDLPCGTSEEIFTWMEKNAPEDFALCRGALEEPVLPRVREWVRQLLGGAEEQ